MMWMAVLITGALLLMAIQYWLFPLSTLPGSGLRYLVFPPLILALFISTGARYVQHVYSLKSMGSGFRYLTAKIFGQNLPVLLVSDGKIMVNVMGQENLLSAVGGPGYLLVMPGNVALLEGMDGSVRVVGSGRQHFVTALETVKDALSLEERYDQIEKISATTRDGIEITAREVRYRYRIYAGEESLGFGRTPENPYPYSDEGVINLVYSRPMEASGLADWHVSVKEVVEGIIQNYIRTNMVDHLTAPTPGSEDPRSEIDRLFKSETARAQFRARGAELLWIDVGHMEMPEKVAGQRVDLWQMRWSGNVKLIRAQGEAERVKYQEMARAEAQAAFLTNIIKTLENADSQGGSRADRQTLYLTGITQMLDMLDKASQNPLTDTKKLG